MSESNGNGSDRRVPRAAVLYAVAVFGGLLATGAVLPGVVLGAWNTAYYDDRPVEIPVEVYLYAYLGAMVYVLIAVLRDPSQGKPAVVRMVFRIPAALLLVTGVYLLVSLLDFGPIPELPRGMRGVAFVAYLTGLFVESALRSIGAVASRLYPGNPSDLLLTVDARRPESGDPDESSGPESPPD